MITFYKSFFCIQCIWNSHNWFSKANENSSNHQSHRYIYCTFHIIIVEIDFKNRRRMKTNSWFIISQNKTHRHLNQRIYIWKMKQFWIRYSRWNCTNFYSTKSRDYINEKKSRKNISTHVDDRNRLMIFKLILRK